MTVSPDKLARVLKVLSVPTRLQIVELLRGRTLCVNALARKLDVTQGAVSQHLRVMRDAELVIDEKRGYFVHYRLNAHTLAAWRAALGEFLAPSKKHRCQDQGEPTCAAAKKRTRSKAARSRRS